MCIICIKKPGYDMPSETTLENMWYANPDGAGIMYTNGTDKVTIKKGFMSYNEFIAGVEAMKKAIDVRNEAVVLHFRIGTSGGNVAGNTHPFPISEKVSDLKKLSLKTNLGIAHNGIISITPSQKDISDTMEYIKSRLMPIYRAKKHFFKYDDIMALIKKEIASKMVFLSPNKSIYTVGDFITDDNGLIYSNSSYLRTPMYRYNYSGSIVPYNYSYSDYDYGDYDDYSYSKGNHNTYKYGSDSDWLTYNERLTIIDDDCYVVDKFTGDAYGVDTMCGYDYLCGIDKFGEVYLIDPVNYENVVAFALMSGFTAFYPNGRRIYYNDKDASDVVVDGLTTIDPEIVINRRA